MKNKILNSNKQKQVQKSIIALIAGIISLGVMVYLLMFLTTYLGTPIDIKASPGMHGDKTVGSGTVIVNEYTNLTANVSAGSNQLAVGSNTLNSNGRFSGNLSAGELVMIIQIQGATIIETDNSAYGNISAYNNCGNFEFAEVSGVSSPNKINLTNNLVNSYTSSGKVQVIRVPRYMNLTVQGGATITCPAWDGSTGGIVAIEVNKITTINGTIDVTGKGFRGGMVEQQTKTPGNHISWRSTDNKDGAEKGESIAGYQSAYSQGRYGRGAPANGGGGGNSHNGGGGGGANGNNGIVWNGKGNPDNSNSNWTTAWELEASGFSSNTSSGGGRGGYCWSFSNQNPLTLAPGNASWSGDSRFNMGGFGGRPLNYSGGEIFMGGGGGAGDSNDNKGTDGGNGGGILFLAGGGTITGSGILKANGNAAATVTGATNMDAPGGGGGGGTIIAYSRTGSVTNLVIQANGGQGGSWTNTAALLENEGAGGGGGGGYIRVTNPTGLTQSVTPGSNGLNNNSIMNSFKPNGSTRGASGQLATNPPSPYSGTTTLPVVLTNFTGQVDGSVVVLSWTTESEINNNYFTLEKSPDGISFRFLETIKGAGNSTSSKSYSATDEAPFEGHTYFRLTQTDFNGNRKSFTPIVVDLKKTFTPKASSSHIYPNPFHDNVYIDFEYDGADVQAQIRLTNITGRPVQYQMINLVNGKNIFTMDRMKDLPSGFYILYIETKRQQLISIKLYKN